MATTHHLHPLVLLPGEGQHLPRGCPSQPQLLPFFLRELRPGGAAAGWAAQALHPPASKAPAWLKAAVHSTQGKGARVQGQEVGRMENRVISLGWGPRALSPQRLGALPGTPDGILPQHKSFQGHLNATDASSWPTWARRPPELE